MPEGTATATDITPTTRATTPTETIVVATDRVACDGGDGPLGHPRVFLHLIRGEAVCPYCSRCYVLDSKADGAGGH